MRRQSHLSSGQHQVSFKYYEPGMRRRLRETRTAMEARLLYEYYNRLFGRMDSQLMRAIRGDLFGLAPSYGLHPDEKSYEFGLVSSAMFLLPRRFITDECTSRGW